MKYIERDFNKEVLEVLIKDTESGKIVWRKAHNFSEDEPIFITTIQDVIISLERTGFVNLHYTLHFGKFSIDDYKFPKQKPNFYAEEYYTLLETLGNLIESKILEEKEVNTFSEYHREAVKVLSIFGIEI